MKHEFWFKRWEDDNIGFHRYEVNPFLEKYFHRFGLKPQEQILVPLCGKSLDMIWANKTHDARIVGIELSDKAVMEFTKENQLEMEEKQKGPFRQFFNDQFTIFQGDFFQLTPELLEGRQIKAIYDRAAFIALPEPMRKDYVAHLLKLTKAQCPILLITLYYDEKNKQGPPFSISQEEVKELYGNHYEIELLEDVDLIHEAPDAKFLDKGLDFINEYVYYLTPKDKS